MSHHGADPVSALSFATTSKACCPAHSRRSPPRSLVYELFEKPLPLSIQLVLTRTDGVDDPDSPHTIALNETDFKSTGFGTSAGAWRYETWIPGIQNVPSAIRDSASTAFLSATSAHTTTVGAIGNAMPLKQVQPSPRSHRCNVP